jgi:hypothetical protein
MEGTPAFARDVIPREHRLFEACGSMGEFEIIGRVVSGEKSVSHKSAIGFSISDSIAHCGYGQQSRTAQ